MAPQLTATSGFRLRVLAAWMALAITSLPTPLSPVISTVMSVGATCSMTSTIFRMATDSPRMAPSSPCGISDFVAGSCISVGYHDGGDTLLFPDLGNVRARLVFGAVPADPD